MVFFLLSISSIINSLSSLTAITGCAPSNLKFWYRLCREREREREERERERERRERERERERERVPQWISFIILLINTFTWKEQLL